MKYLISELLKGNFIVEIHNDSQLRMLLEVCDKNGVCWFEGDKATDFYPPQEYPYSISVKNNGKKIVLGYCKNEFYERSIAFKHYIFIDFSDIKFIDIMSILLNYGRKEFEYGRTNYSIAYDHSEDEIVVRREHYWQDYSPVFFDSEELLMKAVKEAGEDNVKEQLFDIKPKPKELIGYKVTVPYMVAGEIGNFLDICDISKKEDGVEISAIDYYTSNRDNLTDYSIEQLFINGSNYTWFIPYDHLEKVYEGER